MVEEYSLSYVTRSREMLLLIQILLELEDLVYKLMSNLKEYYEIVGESRPLSAYFPTHADLFTEMHK